MSAKWTLGELRRYVADRELDACREVVPVSYTHLTLPTTPYV